MAYTVSFYSVIKEGFRPTIKLSKPLMMQDLADLHIGEFRISLDVDMAKQLIEQVHFLEAEHFSVPAKNRVYGHGSDLGT